MNILKCECTRNKYSKLLWGKYANTEETIINALIIYPHFCDSLFKNLHWASIIKSHILECLDFGFFWGKSPTHMSNYGEMWKHTYLFKITLGHKLDGYFWPICLPLLYNIICILGQQEFPWEHLVCLRWPATAHAHPAAQFDGAQVLSFSLRENWAAHTFGLKEKKLWKLQVW